MSVVLIYVMTHPTAGSHWAFSKTPIKTRSVRAPEKNGGDGAHRVRGATSDRGSVGSREQRCTTVAPKLPYYIATSAISARR